jgi:hypothetical protein
MKTLILSLALMGCGGTLGEEGIADDEIGSTGEALTLSVSDLDLKMRNLGKWDPLGPSMHCHNPLTGAQKFRGWSASTSGADYLAMLTNLKKSLDASALPTATSAAPLCKAGEGIIRAKCNPERYGIVCNQPDGDKRLYCGTTQPACPSGQSTVLRVHCYSKQLASGAYVTQCDNYL